MEWVSPDMPVPATLVSRVFLVCAPQDLKYAELIAAKARGDRMPLAFDSFGDGRPSELSWQLECRRRIRSARTAVVLVSPHTSSSARAMWQVRCARQEGVPVLGITLAFDDTAGPAQGASVDADALVKWKWKAIAATLTRLATTPPQSGEPAHLAVAEAPPAAGYGEREATVARPALARPVPATPGPTGRDSAA